MTSVSRSKINGNWPTVQAVAPVKKEKRSQHVKGDVDATALRVVEMAPKHRRTQRYREASGSKYAPLFDRILAAPPNTMAIETPNVYAGAAVAEALKQYLKAKGMDDNYRPSQQRASDGKVFVWYAEKVTIPK